LTRISNLYFRRPTLPDRQIPKRWADHMRRVQRLYRLEGLQLRHRDTRREHAVCIAVCRQPRAGAHDRWSMDFIHDATMDRVLTVIDQRSGWSSILEVAPIKSGGNAGSAVP